MSLFLLTRACVHVFTCLCVSISSPGQIHTEARGRGWIAFSVASPPNFLGWHSVEIWPSPPPHGNKSRGALQCLVLWVPGINCRLSEACAVRTVLMEPSSQPIRENVLDKGGFLFSFRQGRLWCLQLSKVTGFHTYGLYAVLYVNSTVKMVENYELMIP